MPTRPPDQVNERLTTFNEPGQLWNDNSSKKTTRYNFLRQVFDEVSLPNITQDESRPKILTSFAATDEDLDANAVIDDSTAEVPREPIYGSFAAVRALRVLHQYRVGFWGDGGVIETITATQRADPTSADIDTMYAKFLLFSYLPDELSPTREEFADLVTPSKNSANVRNALSSMGISAVVGASAPDRFFNDNPIIPPTLADPYPFGQNLSSFCDRV